MSLALYNHSSFKLSKALTNLYSTSFSLGIRVFSKEFRDPVYAIYGYVRLADEIVDTFHDWDKKQLLDDFRNETFRAIKTGISTNPVINAFQHTVREFNIDHSLINAFLNSMERDLYNSSYDRDDYDNYIFGSAEAVGLMCLYVFVNGNHEMYKKLEYPAQMLGSAFQKVNFLRDIKSDIDERGRIYLPGATGTEYINDANKQKLEDEVDREFIEALKGIKQLPSGAKLGVYSAFLCYQFLFRKIKRTDIKKLLKERVRISNPKKIALLLRSFVEVKLLETT